MNILRVITTMDPSTGGPCQGIRSSMVELQKYPHSNEVVSLDDPKATFLGNDSFPIHALGPAKGPWSYSTRLIPWLLANLGRFDVVIVHGLWLYHSYAVRKALQQLTHRLPEAKNDPEATPKCYVMPHGMLDPWFQRSPTRKLKAIRNWIYWKLVEAKVVNEADGVLFTSEAELALARQPFRPYQPKSEINVGYGIAESPAYKPSMHQAFLDQCPGLQQHPYLLFLSRIHEKKGVDLLIKAYASLLKGKRQLNQKIPKLVIAGPGLETAFGQTLLKLIADDTTLHGCVLFTGMLTGDAKWGAFYGCEAFVLPSHQENFGIAVVEALACSKPVLISDQVNIWGEINAAGGGIVVPNSLEGTQQALVDWLSLSSHDKMQMGCRAKESFNDNFAIDTATTRLLSAVSEVV